MSVRVVVGVALAMLVLWAAFAVALVAVRPRAVGLREARRAVPDVIRLLRSLHGDRSLPAGVRWWLRALLVYLALPIDLVPDFVPVLGYADDVIIVALALRRVARLAGTTAIEQHWTGGADGLAVVRRLVGLPTAARGERRDVTPATRSSGVVDVRCDQMINQG